MAQTGSVFARDAYLHQSLEKDRGPNATLLGFIDDATSRLMHLQFVESGSTFAYYHATRAYLEVWGKPVAFYSDKHGVFRVNHPGALALRKQAEQIGAEVVLRTMVMRTQSC